MESFDALGYYFIVFRALDEKYFKTTTTSSPTPSPGPIPVSPEKESLGKTDSPPPEAEIKREMKGEGAADTVPAVRREKGRGRTNVEIVEGVGGKEGVEGVGVGAVNLYLVVFADGILSVSAG